METILDRAAKHYGAVGMRNGMIGLSAIGVVLQLVSAAALADPSLESIELANSLENEHETPHTKWAKPYAGGTVRTLFITQQSPNINGLPLRHAVELMQRFDLSGDAALAMTEKGNTYAIAYAGGSGVFGGETGEKRLARLLEKPYDCYVVRGSVMGHLPDEARKTVLRHVEQGAGMVFVYGLQEEDKPLLKEFEAVARSPESLAGLEVRCFTRGKGRMVSLDKYPSDASWNAYAATPRQLVFGFGVRRDLYYEAQGRAVLWAADREPKLELEIDVGSDAIARDQLASHPIKLSWNDKSGSTPRRIRVRIRSEARGSQELSTIDDLGSARGHTGLDLPTLPAGSYWIDAIADGKNGVAGWVIKGFSVTTPQGIRKVNLDREWGEAGDPIRGTVELSAPAVAGRSLRVHAVDRHGRVLARQEMANPTDQVAFSLPTDARMPGYIGVEAALVEGGREIDHTYYPGAYTITRRKQDQWNFMVWGRLYATQFLELADDVLAASGVTSRIETSHVPWWYMTRAGMNYTPYCGSGLYRLPDSGPQEPSVDEHGILTRADGCWNDEPAASQRLRKWLDDERDFRRHGVLVYSMGDEVAVLGSCLHPSCWKVYQQWLEGEYATIEALNESWGSSFKSFTEIEPIIDMTALVHLTAQQKKAWVLLYANNEHSSIGPTHTSTAWTEDWRSYPRYIDRRSFQYWNFANHCKRFGDAARVMDPQAKCGVEGSDIYLDADIDVIVRNTGWWMPYGGENGETTNEVIRSIAPKGYLHGHFVGGTSFWASFLRGGNTQGKWRIDNAFTPGMRLSPDLRRMFESARILSDGLGTLLNGNPGSQMLDDGIVMLHSMASVKMAKIGDGPSYGIFRWRDDGGRTRSGTPQSQTHEVNRRSHRAWHRNIRASGLQFRYTTDGQIKRGEFAATSCKVMILAQYEVIGPEEEKLIREFVAGGGTLIADVRPGIYGARGKPREGGVLDDLFGMRHTGSAPVANAPGSIAGTIGRTRLKLDRRELYVNPNIEVTTGKALGRAGDTPICIVHEAGKGRAILLNFSMWSYPKLAVHDGPEDASKFFRALLAEAGVEAPLELVDGDGRRHRNIEAMRWRTGAGTEVVALHGPSWGTWPEPNGTPDPPPAPFDGGKDMSVPVTVKLPEPRYVYEMRTGRSIGLTDSFTTSVSPFMATLLAVSEAPLQVPTLAAVADAVARGGSLKLRIDIPRARGGRALKVRATGPDGEEAPWFAQSIIVRGGRAEIDLPVAWNEAVGEWKVTATDLMTTEAVTAVVRVVQ